MYYRIGINALPQVEMLGQIRQPMNWQHSVRPMRENLLIFVQEGDMTFGVSGERFALRRNDYLLVPAGATYDVRSEGGCMYTFVHFNVHEALLARPAPTEEQGFSLPKGAFPYSLPVPDQNRVWLRQSGRIEGEREKIWLMLTECDMYRYEITPNRKFRIDLLFGQILSLLDAGAQAESPARYPNALTQLLLYIHEHYMQPLTLSVLSDRFRLSRQYIMRLFQSFLHTTVTQYITRVKLEHALELLRYSTFRVGEVSEILGFGNAYYFCRLFKRHFGVSPTEFMRQGLPNHEAADERQDKGEFSTPLSRNTEQS